ncbi:MAG: BrnT family toxin [Cyanobacteria bacterium J06607_15]
MTFDWDTNKAEKNLSKHQVSFDEATTVFDDPFYIDFYDPDHSRVEEIYLIVGTSSMGRVLIVSYSEKENHIRIISARKATKSERIEYEQG